MNCLNSTQFIQNSREFFDEIDEVSTAFVRIIYEVDWKLVGIIGFGGIAR